MGRVSRQASRFLFLLFYFYFFPPHPTAQHPHPHPQVFFSRNLNNLCVLCCVFGFGIIPSWLVVDLGYW
jgi:hypothetical protein